MLDYIVVHAYHFDVSLISFSSSFYVQLAYIFEGNSVCQCKSAMLMADILMIRLVYCIGVRDPISTPASSELELKKKFLESESE